MAEQVYRFVFQGDSSGSVPTSPGPIPVKPGGSDTTQTPEIPKSVPQPSSGATTGGVTEQDVQRIVDRAASKQEKPPTVQVSTSKEEQQQAPVPQGQQPTSPQRPAGEATLDAIREAASRSAERQQPPQSQPASGQQTQQGNAPSATPVSIPHQMGQQPQQSQPTSPQPPASPQQPTSQPAPQVIQQFVQQAQPRPAGWRELPQHPDLPQTRPDIPLPQPNQPKQPPSPDQNHDAKIRQAIAQLIGTAGSTFNLPGSGTAAAAIGATSAVGLGMAGIGAFGAMGAMYNREVSNLSSMSPEIAQAKANADVKETMRLLEQAKKYGEQDAKTYERIENAKRAAWQFGVNRFRRFTSGEYVNPLRATPVGMYMELWDSLKDLFDTWREFTRDNTQPLNPVSRFKESWDHLPPPPPFDKGSNKVLEESKYRDVITGL